MFHIASVLKSHLRNVFIFASELVRAEMTSFHRYASSMLPTGTNPRSEAPAPTLASIVLFHLSTVIFPLSTMMNLSPASAPTHANTPPLVSAPTDAPIPK